MNEGAGEAGGGVLVGDCTGVPMAIARTVGTTVPLWASASRAPNAAARLRRAPTKIPLEGNQLPSVRANFRRPAARLSRDWEALIGAEHLGVVSGHDFAVLSQVGRRLQLRDHLPESRAHDGQVASAWERLVCVRRARRYEHR